MALQGGVDPLVEGAQGITGFHPLPVHREDPVLQAEGAPRPHPHDGEAALAPPLHRLQKEAHRSLLGKLQVGGHRGLQVREEGFAVRSDPLHAVPQKQSPGVCPGERPPAPGPSRATRGRREGPWPQDSGTRGPCPGAKGAAPPGPGSSPGWPRARGRGGPLPARPGRPAPWRPIPRWR